VGRHHPWGQHARPDTVPDLPERVMIHNPHALLLSSRVISIPPVPFRWEDQL
jgi:hypothetical protein